MRFLYRKEFQNSFLYMVTLRLSNQASSHHTVENNQNAHRTGEEPYPTCSRGSRRAER
ncbi:uncharacterized protein CELE_F19G12.4 [Caenorhabditis elegans]|uniref:Uncharacterized protein n=1 Tax=Caenorhabditis elegans TaxID=6239 RepID=Q19597_CAEEL|nr:Uncharacterized protein CELE_F19G12.4 [Caenorhabditis elegans]CCD69735.1 Uncharacterized protein CELE_F19G12.4 [Caenorhabditis elegans]|eukprot:NP_508267.1 Uncharacterized protein CELE_F19G12.4 [Caenorhabditis elegans]